jgi:hypothetical protein
MKQDTQVTNAELEQATKTVNDILGNPGGPESFMVQFARERNFPLVGSESTEVGLLLLALHRGWWTEKVQLGGYYDHFKGGFYFVEKRAKDAERGVYVYVYQSVYTEEWFTRQPNEWGEIVEWPDRMLRSRFVLRGLSASNPPPTFKVEAPPELRNGSRVEAR